MHPATIWWCEMQLNTPWLVFDMDSNPLHHGSPACMRVISVYMDMLDGVSTSIMRPPAQQQNLMWYNFLLNIGAGYNRDHQLEVQNPQRFLVACLRYDIPTT